MALIDTQEQVRAAWYDTVRLQFVLFCVTAVDLPNGAAGSGDGGVVVVAAVGALPGDYVLFGSLVAWEAGVVLGVPQVNLADQITFSWTNITAGALDPASNNCNITVLRPM